MQYAFVDTENIGKNFDSLFEILKPKSKIVLFYTDVNRKCGFSLELLDKCFQNQYELVPMYCNSGEHDMLDFCLISQLGYTLCKTQNKSRSHQYIIYSNDSGFDGAVRYWQNMGFNVLRVLAETKPYFQIDLVKEEVKMNTYKKKLLSSGCPKYAIDYIAEVIAKSKYLPSNERLSHIYFEICGKYGDSKGKKIYKSFRNLLIDYSVPTNKSRRYLFVQYRLALKKGVSCMKQDKYLPVGTVVSLHDTNIKFIIMGIKPFSIKDNKEYDYAAVIYPMGLVSKEIALFNTESIEEVIHLGYSDRQRLDFLNEFIKLKNQKERKCYLC